MDFSKLIILIERNRVLNEMSSLPFVVKSNKDLKLAWFCFTIEPTERGMVGKIKKIFIIDKNMVVKEEDVCLNAKIEEIEQCEPEMSEKEYMEKLPTDYQSMNSEKNLYRIKKTILNWFIPLYEEVFQWIILNYKNG